MIVSADIMDTESDDEEIIKERATSKNGGRNRELRKILIAVSGQIMQRRGE